MNEPINAWATYEHKGWDGEEAEPVPAGLRWLGTMLQNLNNDAIWPAPGGDGSVGIVFGDRDGAQFYVDLLPDGTARWDYRGKGTQR